MSSKIYDIIFSNKKYDYFLITLVITLVLLGLFTIFSASAYVSEITQKDSFFYLKKQLAFSIFGLVSMFIAMTIDFYHVRKYIKFAMIATAITLTMTYFSMLGGTVVNGASGWIRFGGIGFQPSEGAKIVLICFTANLLANSLYQKLSIKDKLITFIPIASIIGIVVFEPDIGNASVISLAVFSIYFAAGLPIKYITSTIALGGAGLTFLIFNNPYQMARITGFLDPWADPQGKGFQLIQSLIAIGSGGFTGKGIGQSMQKLFYLPESHTDFIFAVFCEETGLIGSLTFLFIIFLVAKRGFMIAKKNKDPFIKLMSTGITTTICGQALMNIGVATGSLPTTGITLPFISYGGSSLVLNMFCMGLLINASRYTSNQWEVLEGKKEV